MQDIRSATPPSRPPAGRRTYPERAEICDLLTWLVLDAVDAAVSLVHAVLRLNLTPGKTWDLELGTWLPTLSHRGRRPRL